MLQNKTLAVAVHTCLQFKSGDHISHRRQSLHFWHGDLQTRGGSSPLPVLQHFSKCLGASVRPLECLLFNLFPLLLFLLQIWSVTLPTTFPFCKVLTRNHTSPVIPEFLHTLSSRRREHAGVSCYTTANPHSHMCQDALILLFIAVFLHQAFISCACQKTLT